jgi:hypothetical protein
MITGVIKLDFRLRKDNTKSGVFMYMSTRQKWNKDRWKNKTERRTRQNMNKTDGNETKTY